MTHITIASTLLEQPIAINGRTAKIPTNRLVPLDPIAFILQVEPDDICATLDAAHVSYERVGGTQTLGAVTGDEGGGAAPGGFTAPPIPAEARDDALAALVAGAHTNVQTGPADQIAGPQIEGETAPLVPGEGFPGDPPAPPTPPAPSPEPSLLDQSIPNLTAALANVTSLALIDALIADETSGKTRAGALEALAARRAEIEAAEAPQS